MKSATDNQGLKQKVGIAAAKLVEDGMIVGIGTGSTIAFFIEELGKRVREGLSISGVATSYQSKLMCCQWGIPIIEASMVDRLDLAIDGADEIDGHLNVIKGGGAAQTIEKIIATMADEFIVIGDESKQVESLGIKFPIPVEVIPAALGLFNRLVKETGAEPKLRMAIKKDGPVISDNGNFIVDLYFKHPPDIHSLENILISIPGVLETGLFLNMVCKALISKEGGVSMVFPQPLK